MGDFELADAAARSRVIEHDAPDDGLWNAGVAFDLDDVLEGVLAALGGDGAKGLVGGIRTCCRGGDEGEGGATEGESGVECEVRDNFHGKIIKQ
jgi:hypothetical protein